MKDITDYLLPVKRDDWHLLLANWAELIPQGSTPWLLSKFGELFFEQPNKKIGMLQVSAFQYEVIAESKTDFQEWLEDPDKMVEWFLAPLVDRLSGSRIPLAEGRCYSFRTPLGLGGQPTEANVVSIPIQDHFRGFGEVYRQIRDLPPGTDIRVKKGE